MYSVSLSLGTLNKIITWPCGRRHADFESPYKKRDEQKKEASVYISRATLHSEAFARFEDVNKNSGSVSKHHGFLEFIFYLW